MFFIFFCLKVSLSLSIFKVFVICINVVYVSQSVVNWVVLVFEILNYNFFLNLEN